ncbi:MAG: GntR family transcriptional regulator [Gaiellaceae bacterium]
MSFVPRYHEIEQALRARIAELEPDEPLPSDAMLCEEFGVSRMTARNAVQRLVQEGLVYRLPGRGTFVARPLAHRQAGKVWSFTDEMRRRGRAPSSRLVERAVRRPTPEEATQLRLGKHASAVAVRRVRLADGEPIVLEHAVFPETCAPPILAAELEHGSLHATLVAAGRVPTTGRATLTAETATAEDARLLGLECGAPLLVERRLIADQRGRPLELTESRYAGSRYALDVDFDVEVEAVRR